MNTNTTTPAATDAAPSPQLDPASHFTTPAAVREDLAFGLEVGDVDIVRAAMKLHGITVDSFISTEVTERGGDLTGLGLLSELPPMRITSVDGLYERHGTPDVLLVLPEASFSLNTAVTIALKIVAAGHNCPELAALNAVADDGSELTLFAGSDKSPGGEPGSCWVFAPHPDRATPARVVSTARH